MALKAELSINWKASIQLFMSLMTSFVVDANTEAISCEGDAFETGSAATADPQGPGVVKEAHVSIVSERQTFCGGVTEVTRLSLSRNSATSQCTALRVWTLVIGETLALKNDNKHMLSVD